MGDRDWETVTFHKKKKPNANNALQSGEQVATTKKFAAGTNKQNKGTDTRALEKESALDEDSEKLGHNKVSLEQAQAIQKARLAKGWTQEDLAKKLFVQKGIIADYEKHSAIPDQQLLAKMERQLGVKLRGKNIGEPFAKPKPKT